MTARTRATFKLSAGRQKDASAASDDAMTLLRANRLLRDAVASADSAATQSDRVDISKITCRLLRALAVTCRRYYEHHDGETLQPVGGHDTDMAQTKGQKAWTAMSMFKSEWSGDEIE